MSKSSRSPYRRLSKGDVLVRVRAALTCGTDVKVFRRGYHARMIVPPALFGHELAGDIVAVGSDVKGFRVGQRVVAANSAPCLDCFYCKRGLENLCEDLLFNNGAYAEYIRIPDADRQAQHVRDSGAHQLPGRRARSSRSPACCAASKKLTSGPAITSRSSDLDRSA